MCSWKGSNGFDTAHIKTCSYLLVDTPGGTEDNKSGGTTGGKSAGKSSARKSQEENEAEESGEEKGRCLSCAISLWDMVV